MKRVAIYARKSVMADKGDSLNSQIAECKDFINVKYRKEEIEFIVYDKDEGYSGANVFRPDFQKMMRDVEQKKIDVVVCYKLDRISRSVADFADIIKKLDKNSVSFYSASQAFETATNTGKMMMGILMVFAEFERATLRERIIDNMYALAKTERWIGGKAPIGYKLLRFEVEGTKKKQTILEVDDAASEKVQDIFAKYVEFRSMSKIETYLLQNHIKSQNDKNLSTSQLATILKNPAYAKADERVKDFYVRQGASFHGEVNGESGLMTYRKNKAIMTDDGKHSFEKMDIKEWIISVGVHPGIIEADVWLEAQRIMQENHDAFPNNQKSHTALVSSLLQCSCGSPMAVTYGSKDDDGNKVYYYYCKLRKRSKGERCSNKNVRADVVDRAVINEIKSKGIDKELYISSLRGQLEQGRLELSHNPAEFIRDDIAKKEVQVKRLFARVSQTDNADLAIDYENQIRELKKDINSLQAELSAVGERKTAVYQTESALEFIEALLDKYGHIDELELEERQALVRVLFKRIKWDAKSGNLSFEYKMDNGGDDGRDGGDGESGDDDGGNGGGGSGSYTSFEPAMVSNNRLSHYSTQSSAVARVQQGHIDHGDVHPAFFGEDAPLVLYLVVVAAQAVNALDVDEVAGFNLT